MPIGRFLFEDDFISGIECEKMLKEIAPGGKRRLFGKHVQRNVSDDHFFFPDSKDYNDKTLNETIAKLLNWNWKQLAIFNIYKLED